MNALPMVGYSFYGQVRIFLNCDDEVITYDLRDGVDRRLPLLVVCFEPEDERRCGLAAEWLHGCKVQYSLLLDIRKDLLKMRVKRRVFQLVK